MTDRNKKRPAPPRIQLPAWKLPTHCAHCDAEDMTTAITAESVMKIHGEEVTYTANKYQCSACEYSFQSPAQATSGTKLAREAFQLMYGLLKPAEIIAMRKELDLSQSQLAQKSKIGIASIKRWESGKAIQTRENDAKLRKKFAELKSTEEYQEVSYHMATSSLGWGKLSYSPAKFMAEAFSKPPQKQSSYGISDEALCAH